MYEVIERKCQREGTCIPCWSTVAIHSDLICWATANIFHKFVSGNFANNIFVTLKMFFKRPGFTNWPLDEDFRPFLINMEMLDRTCSA